MESIRGKLSLIIILFIVITSLVTILLNTLVLSVFNRSQSEKDLIDHLDVIKKQMETKNPEEFLQDFEQNNIYKYMIIDETTEYTSYNEGLTTYMVDLINEAAPTGDEASKDSDLLISYENLDNQAALLTIDDTNKEFTLLATVINNGPTLYVISEDTVLSDYRTRSLIVLITSVILVTIGGFIFASILSRNSIKPIRAINDSLRRMSSLNSDHQCSVDRDDELGEISRRINELSKTLNSTVSSLNYELEEKNRINVMRQTLLTNMIVAIKPPVKAINASTISLKLLDHNNLEINDLTNKIQTENRHIDRLVDQITHINHYGFDNQKGAYESLDLHDLLTQKVEGYQGMCEKFGATLRYTQTAPCLVKADISRLTKVIENYLENSIYYSDKSSEINIRVDKIYEIDQVRTVQDSKIYRQSHYRFSVFNLCPFINVKDMDQLFEYFFTIKQADPIYKGHGLGLSIVKAIGAAEKCDYGVYKETNGIIFYFDILKAD